MTSELLQGKIALVTGGGQGIGKAIGRRIQQAGTRGVHPRFERRGEGGRQRPSCFRGSFYRFGLAQVTTPIASISPEERYRRLAEEVGLFQGVSAYEQLIKEGTDGRITIPWPPNLVLFYENRLLITGT